MKVGAGGTQLKACKIIAAFFQKKSVVFIHVSDSSNKAPQLSGNCTN